MNPQIEKLIKLPTKQKVALLGLLVLLIGAAFFFTIYQPKLKQLGENQKRLEELKAQASEAQKLANNLPKYKMEYDQLQTELKKALTELPNQQEIPSLLTSIANAGKGAGLEVLLFKPKPEEPKEFYAAVPVEISVSGSFYSIAEFFQAVSALPRIVNISGLNFSDIKQVNNATNLKVNCLATTFRFLDKKEIKDEKKSK